MMPLGSKKPLLPNGIARPAMSFEDDLRRVEEHVAEARRFVQRQKGLIVRLKGSGREHIGCPENTLAAGIEPSAI